MMWILWIWIRNTSTNIDTYYIIYPDGQSVSSSMRVEAFAVLFCAIGIVLLHKYTAKGDPGRRPGIPQPYSTGTIRYGMGQLGST